MSRERVIEVRGGSGGLAYEVTKLGGNPIEYRDGAERMRALGCPEKIILRMQERCKLADAREIRKATNANVDAEHRKRAAELAKII